MIKNWQKWFICIFAVAFVSIYLVFDAMFLAKDNVELPPPIIAEEEEPLPPEINGDAEPDEPINEPTTPIPTYTNGYVCLEDALNRFYQSTNYVWRFASSANSLGIIQNLQGVKQLSGNKYFAETRAYCDSTLGQRWYEQITSSDLQNYNYIKTSNINSNLEYNIDGITPTAYTKQQIIDMGGGKLDIFSLTPKKGVDKLAKFDRDSSKLYYIISFVLNVNKLPDSFIDSIKNESGASSVSYKSIRLIYYISKTTGNIEKFEQDEIYTMTMGISLDITYKFVAQLKIS